MRSAFVAIAILGASSGSALAQEAAAVVPPTIVHEVKPQYPEAALAEGLSGTVTLECVVNADGSVGEVRVLTPLDSSLDEEAVKALKQWRFKPGTKDGVAVPVAVTVEMSFTYRPKGPRLDSPEVFKIGGDVTAPKVVREVKPFFVPEAMRAGVQGVVEVECVVLPDGTVGDARVRTPLHPQLDAEALKSVRRWQFTPGLKAGKPVPVQVSIEMTFTLK